MSIVNNTIYTHVCEQVLRAHILCKSMEKFDEFSSIKVNLSQPLYHTLDHSCSVIVQFIRYASFRPNRHQTYFTLHQKCSRAEHRQLFEKEKGGTNNVVNNVYCIDTIEHNTPNYNRINVGCAFIVTFWLENRQLHHCWHPYILDEDENQKGEMSYVSFSGNAVKENNTVQNELNNNVLCVKREIAERLIQWLVRSRKAQFVIPGLQSVFSSPLTTISTQNKLNELSMKGTDNKITINNNNNRNKKKKKKCEENGNMSVNKSNWPSRNNVAHQRNNTSNKENSTCSHNNKSSINSCSSNSVTLEKNKTNAMTLLSNEKGWVTEFLSDFVYMLRAWRFLETDMHSVEYNEKIMYSNTAAKITSSSSLLLTTKAKVKAMKARLSSQNTHAIEESETKCLHSSYSPMTQILHYSWHEPQGADKLINDKLQSKVSDQFVTKNFMSTKTNLEKANSAVYSVEVKGNVVHTANKQRIEHVKESDPFTCPPFAAIFLPDGRVACFQNSELINTNTAAAKTRTSDFCVWVTSHGAHLPKTKREITRTTLTYNKKANLETGFHLHHKESEEYQKLTPEEEEESNQNDNTQYEVDESKENVQIFVNGGYDDNENREANNLQEDYTQSEHSPSVHLDAYHHSRTHFHLLPSLLSIQQFLGVESCYSWNDFVLHSSSSSYESVANVIKETDGGIGSITTEELLQDDWMMKTRHILLHNAQMCNAFGLQQIKRLFVAIAHATSELHKRHTLSLPYSSQEMQLSFSQPNTSLNVTSDCCNNEFKCKDMVYAEEVYLRVSFAPIFISTLRLLWSEERQPFWAGTLLCCFLLPLLLIQSPILSIILHELQQKLGKEYGKCITVVRHVERVMYFVQQFTKQCEARLVRHVLQVDSSQIGQLQHYVLPKSNTQSVNSNRNYYNCQEEEELKNQQIWNANVHSLTSCPAINLNARNEINNVDKPDKCLILNNENTTRRSNVCVSEHVEPCGTNLYKLQNKDNMCGVCGLPLVWMQEQKDRNSNTYINNRVKQNRDMCSGTTIESSNNNNKCCTEMPCKMDGSLIVRCLRCGHGGHVEHIQEWCNDTTVAGCPRGCNCLCLY